LMWHQGRRHTGALIHGAEAFVSVPAGDAYGQALRAYARGGCACMACMCM
jgi:hypothetical protein